MSHSNRYRIESDLVATLPLVHAGVLVGLLLHLLDNIGVSSVGLDGLAEAVVG